MRLPTPYRDDKGTLDRILNVKQKVGPHPDCHNQPSDVAAVQALIAMCAREYAGNHHIALPTPTGKFDATTGFYLFEIQWRMKQRNPPTVVDGCVSSATGIGYGSGTYFTIFQLNSAAKAHDLAGWEALMHKHGTTPS